MPSRASPSMRRAPPSITSPTHLRRSTWLPVSWRTPPRPPPPDDRHRRQSKRGTRATRTLLDHPSRPGPPRLHDRLPARLTAHRGARMDPSRLRAGRPRRPLRAIDGPRPHGHPQVAQRRPRGRRAQNLRNARPTHPRLDSLHDLRHPRLRHQHRPTGRDHAHCPRHLPVRARRHPRRRGPHRSLPPPPLRDPGGLDERIRALITHGDAASSGLHAEAEAALPLIGTRIALASPTDAHGTPALEGLATGLAPSGALLLRTDEGCTHQIDAGDVLTTGTPLTPVHDTKEKRANN